MSEVSTPESPVTGLETALGGEDASEAPEAPNGSGLPDKAKLAGEAAKYRIRAREAETALAEAQARIEQYQRAEVERLASDLSAPADLFEVGQVSLADLLDEAGNVDSGVVAESVAALIAARPGLAKYPKDRAVDMSQGIGNNRPGKAPITWGDLLRN